MNITRSESIHFVCVCAIVIAVVVATDNTPGK